MERTWRDYLRDTITELGESDLKMFRDELNNFQPRADYSRIAWGKLEKADVVDLTRLLISCYTENYAVEVVVSVLERMDKKNLARSLRQATGLGEGIDLR